LFATQACARVSRVFKKATEFFFPIGLGA